MAASIRSRFARRLRDLVTLAAAAVAVDLAVRVARLFLAGRYDLKARAAGALAAHTQRLREQVAPAERGHRRSAAIPPYGNR